MDSDNQTLSWNGTNGQISISGGNSIDIDGRYLGINDKADDSDLLDGQDSSYYRNATNLNAGTINDARLPGTISSDITGTAYKLQGEGQTTADLDTVFSEVATGQLHYRAFTSSSTNKPNTTNNANGVITVGLHSGQYNSQLAFSSDGFLYYRNNPGGNGQVWKKMFDDNYHPNADKWTTSRTITLGGDTTGSVTIDGSSNEILNISVQEADNADTLDNLNSSQFLRSDSPDIKTSGNLTFNDSVKLNLGTNNDVSHFFTGANYYTDINSGGIWYIRDGNSSSAVRYIFDVDNGNFTASGNSIANNFITEGSTPGQGGSGDTDQQWVIDNFLGINDTAVNSNLLDGLEGSYYRNASNLNAGTISDSRLPSSISSDITGTAANAADADKLDNQDSSYYRNASNLNAGTISDARLPSTYIF